MNQLGNNHNILLGTRLADHTTASVHLKYAIQLLYAAIHGIVLISIPYIDFCGPLQKPMNISTIVQIILLCQQ
jgi:hypothetical protein